MRRPLHPALFLGALALLCAAAASLVPHASRAESWCADPLWAHEWGVQVFGASGARRALDHAALPAYFHDHATTPAAAGPPVRGMPVDGGERELPVLQLYTGGSWSNPVLGLEVGFTLGDATSWYPQLDVRRTATDTRGAPAANARRQLVQARTARTGGAARFAGAALLPADPTRQLEWDHLALTTQPTHTRTTTAVPWVDRLRRDPDALWVNTTSESERFVYYEARTTETQAIRTERGPTYAAGHRHYLLRNTSHDAVFDVFLTQRDGNATFVFYAPSIPAGATAGLVLEDHRMTPATFAAATRDRLRAQLVDAHDATPGHGSQWSPCVMMRDPAIPFDATESHHLYTREADTLLDLWGPRFFDAPGTTLVYREDTHYLDRVMPLSLYTDMYHFVKLHRAGLALVEGVALP